MAQKAIIIGSKDSYAVVGKDTLNLKSIQNKSNIVDLNLTVINKHHDSFLSFYYEVGSERGYYTISGYYAGTLMNFIEKKKKEKHSIESRYLYSTRYITSNAVASGAGRISGKTLGAVSRHFGFREQDLTVRGTKFFYNEVFIRWHRIQSCYEYALTILNFNGEEVVRITTKDTFAVLYLEEGTYYWGIKPKCIVDIYRYDYRLFYVLSKSETEIIKRDIETKTSDIPDSCVKSVISYCILVNNFLYENAIMQVNGNKECFQEYEYYELYCE